MIKIVLLLIMTMSCASNNKMLRLEQMIQYNNYEIRIQNCFINLNACNNTASKTCWKTHEQCVINTTGAYNVIQKRTKERYNVK